MDGHSGQGEGPGMPLMQRALLLALAQPWLLLLPNGGGRHHRRHELQLGATTKAATTNSARARDQGRGFAAVKTC